MKAGEALVGMKRSGSQLWTREEGQLRFVNPDGGGGGERHGKTNVPS